MTIPQKRQTTAKVGLLPRTPMPRLRPYQGMALFSYGFRPFFFLGSLFAALAIIIWLPLYFGDLTLPTAFAPRDWHVHEMLYGFFPAIITGFLLTAIPNWTGRLPLNGLPLVGLTLLWLAGRAAMATSAYIGAIPAAIIDLAFMATLIGVVLRELVHAKNTHNLKVAAILAVLWLGNLTFQIEALRFGEAQYGIRIGLAATILLIMLIGGRIIPSFTRNWLARENPGALPASFGRMDIAALAVSVPALLGWIILPSAVLTGALLLVAGALQSVRLARWRGDRTIRDRLVLVLHVAYGFVPVGFFLSAAASFGLLPPSVGIHAWAIGAAALMIMAVMSRASLGHTGRALVASPAVQVVYALLVAAALLRICAALRPEWSMRLLELAASAWAAGFIAFSIAYWRVLTGPSLRR